MAVTIDYTTFIINIPQAYLTLVTGTLYELDTEGFREDLKSIEDSENGIVWPDTHNHNSTVTVAGDTYARAIEIKAPFSVEFEDGQISVKLVGSNNNIFDVENGILVQNQVQVIPGNAAGLIVKNIGSGVTSQDKTDIVDGVWNELTSGHTNTGSFGDAISDILSAGGSLTPEQAQQLQDIFDSTDKKLLTKAMWIALK